MQNFIVILAMLAVAGCKQMPDIPTVISPYRIDIQQGNFVTQEMVGKLKPGMTRAQVRFALGSPLVVDPFRTDRWDYIYMLQRQGKETERRNITVIFDDDKLLRIDGDISALQPSVIPAPQPAEKPAPKPAATAVPAAKPAGVETPPPKPPVAVADKPSAKPPASAPAAKPSSVPAPAAKPPVADAGKTPSPKPEATTIGAPATAVKPDSADAKADTEKAGAQAGKSDPQKDKPKAEKGFFGRMLDKIGF